MKEEEEEEMEEEMEEEESLHLGPGTQEDESAALASEQELLPRRKPKEVVYSYARAPRKRA